MYYDNRLCIYVLNGKIGYEEGTKKSQVYFDGGFHIKSDTDNKEIYIIKVGLSPSKKHLFYLLQWNPFKNGEKCLEID